MKRALISAFIVISFVSAAVAAEGARELRTKLTGYEVVPAISSDGSGEFQARISDDESQVTWTLTYSDLEGDLTQAHIHFGQAGVNGSIVVFLCTNLGNGPAGTQACPAAPATTNGTFTAADVLVINAQGMPAGQLAELIRAIRAQRTYVALHTTLFPGGEIRGQINPAKPQQHR